MRLLSFIVLYFHARHEYMTNTTGLLQSGQPICDSIAHARRSRRIRFGQNCKCEERLRLCQMRLTAATVASYFAANLRPA